MDYEMEYRHRGPVVSAGGGDLDKNNGGDRELEMEMSLPSDDKELICVFVDPNLPGIKFYSDGSTIEKIKDDDASKDTDEQVEVFSTSSIGTAEWDPTINDPKQSKIIHKGNEKITIRTFIITMEEMEKICEDIEKYVQEGRTISIRIKIQPEIKDIDKSYKENQFKESKAYDNFGKIISSVNTDSNVSITKSPQMETISNKSLEDNIKNGNSFKPDDNTIKFNGLPQNYDKKVASKNIDIGSNSQTYGETEDKIINNDDLSPIEKFNPTYEKPQENVINNGDLSPIEKINPTYEKPQENVINNGDLSPIEKINPTYEKPQENVMNNGDFPSVEKINPTYEKPQENVMNNGDLSPVEKINPTYEKPQENGMNNGDFPSVEKINPTYEKPQENGMNGDNLSPTEVNSFNYEEFKKERNYVENQIPKDYINNNKYSDTGTGGFKL